MDNNDKMELLYEAKNYLDRLIEGINATIQLFQGGNEGKATQNMIDMIDGLQWLISVLGATEDIQKEKVNIEDINEHLMEMVSAFENTDYVLLSDLLEYEISPLLNNWKETLSGIAEA